MMHSASLPDSTLAYPHFNPCPPGPIASSTSYYSTCGPSLDHPSAMLSNGHTRSPGSTNGLSPATSATVAALTAAAAASAGFTPNVKDSRWLTLEVCRQYQRNQCTRDENECKFAHPPIHVDVQNGRVICCYDSIKGKCQRRDPPCKYLHPPQHLREQLMQNGRNNMIIRNMQLQLFQHQLMAQSGMLPLTPSAAVAAAAVAAAQAAAVASPVSTTNSPVNGANGTPSSLIYPGPGPLAIGAPVPTSTYPFLSMGFTPYLNAITSSGLPTGTSTVAVQLPGTEILPSADTNTSTTPAKRPTLNDAKNGLPLYMPRTNGVHVSNGTSGKVEGQDNNSGAGGCMMVMNGGPMDSLTAAAAAREMTGSPHSCSVTMRSSANTGTNLSVAAAAAATLYALQHPHGPPNAAALLNMHPTHPAAGHPHPMASLQAAPLTAAMMNGSASNMAQAHFSAVPDPTGFFQPACHIEIPSYPYQ